MTLLVSRNLTVISWAHSVNNQHLLNCALNSIDIDMLEADIVMGKLNGQGSDILIMAHPPDNVSDLTFHDFLNQVQKHNGENFEFGKGIKLDFKSIEVFEASFEILDEIIPKMKYPVWLNADIITGPVNSTSERNVDAARFFAGCMRYKQAVLSVGWTTEWGPSPNEGAYTRQEVENMLDALRSNNILNTAQSLTFPVRAGITANSCETLTSLLDTVNETNPATLTIWSAPEDHIDINALRETIYSIGMHRIYLDVPIEVSRALDLGRNASSGTVHSLMNFGFISLCFWALSSWLKTL